ncbi:MAG: hypothetical protein GY775_17340 [Candidatus Scalindua sp.]|nr:hypothetical protein [Candidatus Scalindua sp.]
MIEITDALKAAFNSDIREIHCLTTMNFSDLTVDPSVRVVTTESNNPDFSYQIVNGNTITPTKWLSMDGIGDMSGNYTMMPSDTTANINQVGLWSANLTDATGVCDVSYDITSLARRVSDITINGDNNRGEYPVNYTIKFYATAVLLYTETVTGNENISNKSTLPSIQEDVTKMTINITKWSTPLTNVKIISTLTALTKTFSGTDVINFTIQEESEISNDATIPTGNITYSKGSFSFINRNRQFDINNISSPLYGSIKQTTKIDVKLGAKTTNGVEYIDFWSGWTQGFNAPEDSLKVSTTAYDRLERLKLSTMSPQVLQLNKTAGFLFDLILDDADIASQYRNIDSRLYESKYTVPIYYIQGSNHLTEMKRLSQALSTSVYVENDIIKVDSIEAISFNYITQESYDLSDYAQKTNKPLYSSLYNTVRVPYAPFTQGLEETVYLTPSDEKEIIQPNTTTTLTFFLDKKVTTDHNTVLTPVSGISITTETYYSDRAIIEFTSTSSSAEQVIIEIKAKNYTRLNSKFTEETDVDSKLKYGSTLFEYKKNDMIQSLDLADTIRDNILGTYKDPFRSATVVMKNAGNPALSLTDKISITDRYKSQAYSIVSKKTQFDGGLSLMLKCRKSALADYLLIDNNNNNIVDNNGNNILILIPDLVTAYQLKDNNGNDFVTNEGFKIIIGD